MSTIAIGAPGAQSALARFHFRMAIVFAAICFLGFTPTYWSPIVEEALDAPPIMHIHGALLFAWTLFYVAQTGWVAAGRTPRHRAWGMAGIALFTLMICSIVLLKLAVIRIDEARGLGDASRRFAAVALINLPVLVGLFALAIAQVSRAAVHKRLMYSLMAGLTIPAFARAILGLFAPQFIGAGPPPPFVALPPTVLGALLIVVAMLYDWRSERRVHAAYAWPLLALVVCNVAAVLIAHTPAWIGFVRAFERLAG
jgi:hypothetical protein